MAAPSVTARVTPVGVKPEDGYQTLICFAADPDVSFWEKTVTPIGLDGGDPIDTTTMFNEVWRTMAMRSLVSGTPAKARVTYDPRVLPQIAALLNVPTSVTIHLPGSNATWAFWGGLTKFTAAENSEGSQPEADIEVACTNTDPSDGSEAGPVYAAGVGTGP